MPTNSTEVLLHQVGRMTLAELQDRLTAVDTNDGRLVLEVQFSTGAYEAHIYDSTRTGLARVSVAEATDRTLLGVIAKVMCRAGLLEAVGIHRGDL